MGRAKKALEILLNRVPDFQLLLMITILRIVWCRLIQFIEEEDLI